MTPEQDLQEQQQSKTTKRPARSGKKASPEPTAQNLKQDSGQNAGQDSGQNAGQNAAQTLAPAQATASSATEQNQPEPEPGKAKTTTRRTRRPAAKSKTAAPKPEAAKPETPKPEMPKPEAAKPEAPVVAASVSAPENAASATAGAAKPGSQTRTSPPARRGRGKTPRKPKTAENVVFNPEAFADVYPSVALTLQQPEQPEDGPQPALPNQPSLALPPSEEDEAFLRDLDERVNGNRLPDPAAQRQPANRGKNNQRSKNGRSGKQGDRSGQTGQTGQKRQPEPAAPVALPAQLAEAPDLPAAQPAAQPETKPDNRADNRPKQPGKLPEKQQKNSKTQKQLAAAPKAAEEEKPQSLAKRILYVSVVPDEQVEVLITEDGQVVEYFIEMAHQAKIRGNIYKGVINNVDANLQAAFVNFGVGKNGFLQIDEVHSEYYLNYVETKGGKYPLIQKVLKNGQEVLVQVVKEPSGSKGAFLTTWISLAGRFLVLTPGQEQMGISRKVEDQQERNRLKELLVGLKPGPDLGLILRTAGQDATKTSISKDLQYLKRLWKDILKKVASESTPALIYQEADLASRAVRDYLNEDITEIWVDDAPTQASIQETTNLLFPRKPNLVKLHQDPRQTLWERFNLQRQIEEITSREVILPSGGRLVFDQTEALMAIDINSGKVQGKANGFEDMVYKTNLEAAKAIARHLRLRDIGGQIVIDFIEMRDRNHVREVEKTLRNAMRNDRARHDIGHISAFGLLELVRQRIGSSGISISSEPCPHCHGTGVRRNLEWQALHALRDIQAKLRKMLDQAEKNKGKNGFSPAKALVYETETELGLYLLNHKRDRLLEMENTMQTRIDIIPKA